MSDGNGWDEHKRLVLDKLERVQETCNHIDKKLDAENQRCAEDRVSMRKELVQETAALREDMAKNREQIAVLKFKSTLWSGLAAAIPVVAFALWKMLS